MTRSDSISIRIVVGGLIFCLVALVYFHLPQISAVYLAHKMRLEEPELSFVPTALTDLSVDSSKGTVLRESGMELEVPWTEIDVQRETQFAKVVTFKSGVGVIIFDPDHQVDSIKTLNESMADKGTSLAALYGNDDFASNYKLLKSVCFTTPEQISLRQSRRDAIRTLTLLLLKETETSKSGVFSVETQNFHGFQIGRPQLATNADQKVGLKLFDKSDRKVEIWISAKANSKGGLTQAQINRIIQTLKPSEAPTTH